MSSQQSFMPDEKPRARAFKRKKAKPFEVWARVKGGSRLFGGWWRFGRYVDRKTAEQVLRAKSHDKYFEYELRVKSV